MTIDINRLKQKIKIQEGSIEHMYLDTRGFVTVGVGQLLSSEAAATKLNFVQQGNGQAATRQEIIDEYHHLKKQKLGLSANRYRQYTKLILAEEVIDEMLEQQINYFQSGLQEEFSDYQGFPKAAQEALLDMAFNLGLSGLIKKYPTMVSAVREQDWHVCAGECHRRGIGESRNEETKGLFGKAVAS